MIGIQKLQVSGYYLLFDIFLTESSILETFDIALIPIYDY